MILVLDNYDSFTFNLVHLIARATDEVIDVVKNDQTTTADLEARSPSALVLSPGPGLPVDAGILCDAIRWARGRVPVFGVCLGMQAIAHVLGARVVRAARCMHGRTSRIDHDGRGIFAGLPRPFTAMRYHSWCVDEASLPTSVEATSWAEDGTLMGLRARGWPCEAVQFHPESFASEHGVELIRAFLRLVPAP